MERIRVRHHGVQFVNMQWLLDCQRQTMYLDPGSGYRVEIPHRKEGLPGKQESVLGTTTSGRLTPIPSPVAGTASGSSMFLVDGRGQKVLESVTILLSKELSPQDQASCAALIQKHGGQVLPAASLMSGMKNVPCRKLPTHLLVDHGFEPLPSSLPPLAWGV